LEGLNQVQTLYDCSADKNIKKIQKGARKSRKYLKFSIYYFVGQKRPWIRIWNPESGSVLRKKTLDTDPYPHLGLWGSKTLGKSTRSLKFAPYFAYNFFNELFAVLYLVFELKKILF